MQSETSPATAAVDIDLEKRRIALTAAIAMHGPGALSVDVLESACDFYVWLELPARRIQMGASPSIVAFRRPKAAPP